MREKCNGIDGTSRYIVARPEIRRSLLYRILQLTDRSFLSKTAELQLECPYETVRKRSIYALQESKKPLVKKIITASSNTFLECTIFIQLIVFFI